MKRFVQKGVGVFEPVNPNCTCYDRAKGSCVPQQVCTSCNAFPDSPNCNYRVGNRLVPRFQTSVGGNIYATPTNRFRNAMPMMPLGTDSGGFGLPMGNSGRDAYQNAVGMGNPTMVAPAFGGTQTPSSGINNYCIKCLKKGCGCVRDERGRPRCDCGDLTPSGIRLNKFCKRHPELCNVQI
jgi:hypothetical protein